MTVVIMTVMTAVCGVMLMMTTKMMSNTTFRLYSSSLPRLMMVTIFR